MAGPIVRQGIISLGIEIATPKLSASPAIAAVVQQQKAIATTAQQVTRAVEAESASVRTSSAVIADGATTASQLHAANLQVARGYQQAAMGAMLLVRGFALLGAGQSESVSRGIRLVAQVQGLIDVSRGAIRFSQGLATAYAAQAAAATAAGAATGRFALSVKAVQVAIGPVGWGLIAVAGVIKAFTWLWDKATVSQEEATEAAREYYREVDKLNRLAALEVEQRKYSNEALVERARYLDTLAEKEKVLRSEAMSRGAIVDKVAQGVAGRWTADPDEASRSLESDLAMLEHQKELYGGLLDLQEEKRRQKEQETANQIELIRLRERELKQAQEAVKREEDLARSQRARLGLMTAGEGRRLERAFAAQQAGTATVKQAELLGKAGYSRLSEDAAERLLTVAERRMAEVMRKAEEKLRGEGLDSAREEQRRREAALSEATGGKSASDAIAALEVEKDQAVNAARDMATEFKAIMREVITEIGKLRGGLSRQRDAARNARAAWGA
jgi:hypothetical protein